MTQSEQRFVDLNTFFLRLAVDLGELLTLRARKIDQLELTHNYIVGVLNINLLDSHAEDSVRPTRGEVHLVRANDLVAKTIMEKSYNFILGGALEIEQIFNRIHVERVPFEFEAGGICRASSSTVMKSWLYKGLSLATLEHARVEQVVDSFVVDLQE